MEKKIKVRLKQRLIELIEHLYNENIIEINVVDFDKGSFYDIVVFLRDTLKKGYPKTKIKRIMKSIHYANSFDDESLKQSAFLLDEIEQYLCFNKLSIITSSKFSGLITNPSAVIFSLKYSTDLS